MDVPVRVHRSIADDVDDVRMSLPGDTIKSSTEVPAAISVGNNRGNRAVDLRVVRRGQATRDRHGNRSSRSTSHRSESATEVTRIVRSRDGVNETIGRDKIIDELRRLRRDGQCDGEEPTGFEAARGGCAWGLHNDELMGVMARLKVVPTAGKDFVVHGTTQKPPLVPL